MGRKALPAPRNMEHTECRLTEFDDPNMRTTTRGRARVQVIAVVATSYSRKRSRFKCRRPACALGHRSAIRIHAKFEQIASTSVAPRITRISVPVSCTPAVGPIASSEHDRFLLPGSLFCRFNAPRASWPLEGQALSGSFGRAAPQLRFLDLASVRSAPRCARPAAAEGAAPLHTWGWWCGVS